MIFSIYRIFLPKILFNK